MPAIIVIGASEGGVDAIRALATALPAKFPASVFVVLHIGAHKSQLPALLNLSGHLPASHARDREPILPGRILRRSTRPSSRAGAGAYAPHPRAA